MRLKEEHNTTSTTDLNNNCVKTDDHLIKKQVNLQLKRSSTDQGFNRTNHLNNIELKEINFNNHLNTNNNHHHVIKNQARTSPISSPHYRQPSPSQFSFNNLSPNLNCISTNNHHSKCNGVCVVTSEPKSCKQLTHRHLNGNAFSPSLTSLNALNSTQPHSPLVPSYLSNSSKYTGYSTYGKLTHGTEHLQNTSNLCIDNIHSKTKIYNFKVVLVGDMASGKTSYIRKLTQSKNGSRNRYNYYMATVSFFFLILINPIAMIRSIF